jgi:HPr kinase/phosphorylase
LNAPTMTATSTLHASAVLVGARAVLIRGPSGGGKSALAWALIEAARVGRLRFARLVTDDRAQIEIHHGRAVVRPPPALAGLIEIRGIGLCRLPYEEFAVIGLVVDLAASDVARMPEPAARETVINGIKLPRLAVAREQQPLPAVLTRLALADMGAVPAEV